jgi:hypothetical protein
MNLLNSFKNTILAGACSAAILGAPAAMAQAFFHVDVDTTVLSGNSSAPFSLDFQLIDGGSAGAVNTVVLSNFTFGGGAATGSPNLTGGATGSLASTVTLTDASNSNFNEFFQEFTLGTSIGFDVSITLHDETGAPDGFSVSILDSSLSNITTSGPGDSLVYASITSILSVGDLVNSHGTGSFDGVTTAVPEPSEYGIAFAGLLGGFLLARRRANRG